MKNFLVICCALLTVGTIVDIANHSTTTPSPKFTVMDKDLGFGFSGRTKCTVKLRRIINVSSLTGIWKWILHDNKSLELPRDVWDQVEVGSAYTFVELDEMRGRSNAGKAWDWLKKPRNKK